MIRAAILAAAMCFGAAALWAEEVVLGLSQDEVAITATFEGSEILIFGAVKRDRPVPPWADPLQVAITVAGPSEPVTVRRKERRFGIWVNAASIDVNSAPSFYAVATSAAFQDTVSAVEDLRHGISIPSAIQTVGATATAADVDAFTAALIRIRDREGLYQLREGSVSLDRETLFRTSIAMPANLTEGPYTTRIFLTRGGDVISSYETVIPVRKVGLERWLYTLSRSQPLLYGLMSLAIAIFAGWSAAAAFRLLRS